jgi:hypothetical protein
MALALVVVQPAAAQSGGGCQLQGSANLSPGLNTTSQPFSYSFSGNLTGCQSSQSGAPTSGTVSAGVVLNEQVHNSVTGATDTVGYQEPVASGTGSCASSTTKGESLSTWADGSTTVVDYSTTGALAAVHLTGTAVPSMTLAAVNPPAGDPTTFTINTTRYAGQSALGELVFQPPSPTSCQTGVTTAAISGFIGLGAQ